MESRPISPRCASTVPARSTGGASRRCSSFAEARITTRDAHIKLGSAGEAAARRYLEARGFTFIEANWRCASGELDLVMRDGDELVFVEVKIRRGEAVGSAIEAVTRQKARKVLKTGEWYVARHPQFADLIWRCDIVAIDLGLTGVVRSIEHLPNAIVTG